MGNPTISSSHCNGFSEPEQSHQKALFEMLFINENKNPPCFYINHPDLVNRKIRRMISLGPSHFQVISDFDWTMSKYWQDNGQVNPTCHGVFERDPEMTNEARSKLRMLKQTYGSVEFDKNIPNSLKTPYMLEWWDYSHRVITSCNIHKSTLKTTVFNSNLQLRDGVSSFLSTLSKHDIPVVVFSAGLGNIIELILEKENLLFNNIKVASNFMQFNEEGFLVGFKSPCIHTFNKTFGGLALSSKDRSIFSRRRCVLLLGDSLYDQHMADGLVEEDTGEETTDSDTVILKIGFLNGKIETLLDEYMKLYDIVLPGESSFGLPLEIANCIVEAGQKTRQ